MGCICWEGVGTEATIEGNINNSLVERVWPVLFRHFPQKSQFFLSDCALVYRSRSTQEYVDINHINCVSLSAQSPDLNMTVTVLHWVVELQSINDLTKKKSANLDQNQACLHSKLVWLYSKAVSVGSKDTPQNIKL